MEQKTEIRCERNDAPTSTLIGGVNCTTVQLYNCSRRDGILMCIGYDFFVFLLPVIRISVSYPFLCSTATVATFLHK